MAIDITGKVGWWGAAAVPAVDADAQAFITAANITNTTQQNAIIKLVTDLKGYGVWTKMKAVYPMVGGSASAHKFNLKDPRDLDAAFRLTFFGGWTHSNTGALPNGTTAYADSYLIPSTTLIASNFAHLSYYSNSDTQKAFEYVMGSNDVNNTLALISRRNTNLQFFMSTNTIATYVIASNTSATTGAGFLLGTQLSSTIKLLRSNVLQASNTTTSSGAGSSTRKVYIGANNDNTITNSYTDKLCSFASIGDGLTDTEAANFYTAVQTFQTTLGRQVGVPIVADTDAQAFLNAAVITDTTQASAINTLVTDLKTANIWTKMKALYPFVGGTATTHKFNLKDPRDLDAAYRLVFSGGWTHSSTGAKPNGTTAYADTFLIPSTVLNETNFAHLSYYSNTSTGFPLEYVMGSNDGGPNYKTLLMTVRRDTGEQSFYADFNNATYRGARNLLQTNGSGLFLGTQQGANVKLFRQNVLQASNTNVKTSTGTSPFKVYIGCTNDNGVASQRTDKMCSLASIGDGLTDAEAAAFYTAVQAYQTTLSRNV